ncbi:auxin efflux carrier, partial [Pilobolus umbonatus]
WLSHLNMVFFTPCLLFSNMASVISVSKLVTFWPIPAFFVIFASISWVLSQVLVRVFKVDANYRRFVTACAVFNNANSLPIAIISSLALSEVGKSLFWDSKDTQDTIATRGISYALFFGLFSNLLRWSYGYNLLQKKPENEDDDTVISDDGSDEVTSFTSTYGSFKYGSRGGSSSDSESNIDLEGNEDRPLKKKSYKSSRSSTSSDEEDKTIMSRIKNIVKSIKECMSPPLYAALLALFVGLIAPIKDVLFDEDTFLNTTIIKAIEQCGKASVPIVLICLGAQLKIIKETQNGTSKEIRKPIALSILIRMCLTPACVIPLVYLFVTYGKDWSPLATDPIFIVTMVIVGCTPTAINLVQITQVSNIFEKEMLNVLFWSYGVLCTPVCTFCVFMALNIVDKVT